MSFSSNLMIKVIILEEDSKPVALPPTRTTQNPVVEEVVTLAALW